MSRGGGCGTAAVAFARTARRLARLATWPKTWSTKCSATFLATRLAFWPPTRSVGTVIILTNEDIEPLLNMPDCIAAIEQAFRDFGHGQAVDVPRQDAIVPNSREGAIHDLKTMSGSWPAAGIAALRLNSDIVHWPVINNSPRRVKLAISEPGGRYNGAVLLFSTETGQLLCMLNDGIMQKSRVGASSAVAAKYLAPEKPRALGLL